MSASPWAAYLEGYTDYVHHARRALDGRSEVQENLVLDRPCGPVPDEYAWRLLELVAAATTALDGKRARSTRLLEACRAVSQRALGRPRRREPKRDI